MRGLSKQDHFVEMVMNWGVPKFRENQQGKVILKEEAEMLQPTEIFQNMKQMIIVNEALKLPEEKLAIQTAQASTGAYIEANKTDRKIWLKAGKPQIVLKALNEDDLEDFLLKAERLKLPICARLPEWGYEHQTVNHSFGEYARDATRSCTGRQYGRTGVSVGESWRWRT